MRLPNPLPIVLSFDGSISSYTKAGLAMITVPSVVSDTRTNDYAWNKRTGTFYDLYPYSRNGEAALKEVSNEMAEAWAASLIIDALELCENSEHESYRNAVADLAIDKLAVTGFSINGKYAFVAAVFDDRIDVCIPGAAGATGPSPWRYVYRGQVYDWTDTAYVNSEVNSYQVVWGTEVMANSIRHNRVRETELFRHFLSPGHFYEFEEGAYGYGTRLPFDQNDLVATLASGGRAIIIENTVNDYNDGCTADCLGAEIAKSVYRNLGYDADKLVKFNLRNLKTGDPHGNDAAQRNRSAEYLNYYFFGTQMSEATAEYLGTDPYALKISNNRTESPYDFYWGGFNTITGGTGGVDGRDGWYYYTFPVPEPAQGGSTQSGTSSGTPAAAPSAAPETPAAGTVTQAIPGRITTAPSVTEEPEAEVITEEETPLASEPEDKTEAEPETKQEETSEEVKTETEEPETQTDEEVIADEDTALAATIEEDNTALFVFGAILVVIVLGAVTAYAYFGLRKTKR